MQFVVCSKREATEFESQSIWCGIQINTFKDESHPKISAVKRLDLLQITFPDADSTDFTSESLSESEIKELKQNLFSQEHADKIIDFYLKNKNNCEVLMVHCYAGRCRSPAVAAALSKIANNDDMIYFKNYTPNALVYNAILERAFERGLLQAQIEQKEIEGRLNQ